MKKLIDLLNKFERKMFPEEHEYVKFPDGTDDDGGYWYYREQPNMGENKGFNYSSRSEKRNSELNQLLIISKEFGFIKWLVENDKIDHKKIEDETYVKVNGEWYELILGCHYDLYQQTLMLLSISDTPIEDLISYLK